jgi:hypothetical protein
MHFDPIHVDVDGSLRNPYVVGAVLLWAALLALLALQCLKMPSRFAVPAVLLLLILACAATPRVVRALLNLAYNGTFGSGSVGVIGGPPAWVPSLLAAGSVVLVAAVRRRKAVSRAA